VEILDTGFWLGNLKTRDHLEGLKVDGRIIFKVILKEVGWESMDK